MKKTDNAEPEGSVQRAEVNELLLEEYKQGREHYRWLEARRDRYVIGAMTLSGAALALIYGLDFQKYSNLIVLIALCFILGALCFFLFLVNKNLTPVFTEYEDVVKTIRKLIYVEIRFEDMLLRDKLDVGKNVPKRLITIRSFSNVFLFALSMLWFIATLMIFAYKTH